MDAKKLAVKIGMWTVAAIGSIIGSVGAITTVGLIDAGIKIAKKKPDQPVESKEES